MWWVDIGRPLGAPEVGRPHTCLAGADHVGLPAVADEKCLCWLESALLQRPMEDQRMRLASSSSGRGDGHVDKIGEASVIDHDIQIPIPV
jgi:hypothetical protein